MSHFGLPFRVPCGGWAAHMQPGGCYQHVRGSEKAVPEVTNTTTSGGYPPVSQVAPITDPGSFFDACAGGSTVVDHNCYIPDPEQILDFSLCRKIGFKNVQAVRTWHGRRGFLADPCSYDCTYGLGCSYEPPAPVADTKKYLRVDAYVKYETDYTNPLGVDEDPVVNEYSRYAAVDRNTGILTCGGDPYESSGPDPDGLFDDVTNTCYRHILSELWNSAYDQAVTNTTPPNSGNYSAPVTSGLDTSTGGGSKSFSQEQTVTWVDSDMNYHTDTYTCMTASASLAGDNITYTATETAYYVKDNAFHTYTKSVVTWSASNTRVDYSSTSMTNPGDAEYYGVTTNINTAWGELTIENSGGDVYADCCSLLSHWHLDDDKECPWRIDGFVTIAPLVARWEKPSAQQPTLQTLPYTDPDTPGHGGYDYDGTVWGSPNPAGYDVHFDWRFSGRPAVPGDPCGGNAIYGMWTPHAACGLPTNATHWTDGCAAKDFWPGAWVSLRAGGDQIYMQKWAQIKIHRPAIDFARPYGADRFVCSVTGCPSAYDAETQTLTLTAGVDGISVGDYVLVNWGGISGVYPVTAVTDTSHYVLGSRVWELPDPAPANIEFGRIRWKAAWAIIGRVSVNPDSSGTIIDAPLSGNALYLRAGDLVDIVNDADTPVTGFTSLMVTVNFTDKKWSVLVAPGGPTLPDGTYYVRSHGSPHYWWFDSNSKGDFLYLAWTHNFRDIGEQDRLCYQKNVYFAVGTGCESYCPPLPEGMSCDGNQGTLRQEQATNGMPRSVAEFTYQQYCLPFDPCWPQVMCISPNGESFPLGRVHAFPGTDTTGAVVNKDALAMDPRYGSLWQAIPLFAIEDPFYSPPVAPCGSSLGSPDTTGDCSGDYAHPPLVEARQSVPATWMAGDTAPVLPSTNPGLAADVDIHLVSLNELNGLAPYTGGAVQPPPSPVGDNLVILTDWKLWLNQIHCVCQGGSFSQDYQANEVDYCVECPPSP